MRGRLPTVKQSFESRNHPRRPIKPDRSKYSGRHHHAKPSIPLNALLVLWLLKNRIKSLLGVVDVLLGLKAEDSQATTARGSFCKTATSGRKPGGCYAAFAERPEGPSARRAIPVLRMFFAALMSRSCSTPHIAHRHALIPRPATPFGPVRLRQHEQVWVEYASSTSSNHTPASSHLYDSMVRNALQPASSTLFAMLVFARLDAFTSPMKIAPYPRTSWVLSLCSASLRRALILA